MFVSPKSLSEQQSGDGRILETLGGGSWETVVQGRECTVDVLELPEGSPVLIGQIPLELFDFVIDMRGQRLIGNPDHGGEQILDLL